jgi:hypothetical protein
MSVAETQFAVSKPKRRWFQFSLRTLLVVVTFASVLCSIATYIGWDFIWSLFCSALCSLCSIGSVIGWRMPLAVVVFAAIGGVIAKTRSVEFVRLLGAVIVGLLVCWFVVEFDYSALARFRVDHPGEHLGGTPLGEIVTRYRNYAYAVPVLALLVGCISIWVPPKSRVVFEVVIQAVWILALMWACTVLIAWQWQNVPFFSGMRWHY